MPRLRNTGLKDGRLSGTLRNIPLPALEADSNPDSLPLAALRNARRGRGKSWHLLPGLAVTFSGTCSAFPPSSKTFRDFCTFPASPRQARPRSASPGWPRGPDGRGASAGQASSRAAACEEEEPAAPRPGDAPWPRSGGWRRFRRGGLARWPGRRGKRAGRERNLGGRRFLWSPAAFPASASFSFGLSKRPAKRRAAVICISLPPPLIMK